MTETAHTPFPYLRDGSLIYALDESGTCNRIQMRLEGGFTKARAALKEAGR